MSKRRRQQTIRPLADVAVHYGYGYYPVTVNICMENGVCRRYRDDEIHQPVPRCGVDGWKYDLPQAVGYKMKTVR